MSSVKTHMEKNNPDRVDDFVNNSPAAVKRVVSDFNNFEVAMQISCFQKQNCELV